MRDVKSPSGFFAKSPGAAQTAPICFGAPFEFMKFLERSTIFVPRHVIVSRSVSVTWADRELLRQRLAALPDADGTQLVLDQIHKYMKK